MWRAILCSIIRIDGAKLLLYMYIYIYIRNWTWGPEFCLVPRSVQFLLEKKESLKKKRNRYFIVQFLWFVPECLQPPTITSPLVKAGRVPLAGITEGATLPTKKIQVQAQVSSQSPNLILSNNECRWRLRSVPLGLYTLYTWTGVLVPGQFQLRSQDPGLPSAGLFLRLWWLTGSGEALQPLLPWAIPFQFHSFYPTLGQQVVFQKLELQESPISPLR